MNTWANDRLCGFRKAHSTQNALFRLIQSFEKELDNSDLMGAILMNFLKAYNCLPRDILIRKHETYGIDKPNLNLVNDY